MDYKLFEIDWSYTEPRLLANFRKVEVGQIVKSGGKKFRIFGFTRIEGWIKDWQTWRDANPDTPSQEDGAAVMTDGTARLPFSPTTYNQFGNHTYAIGRLESE